MKIRDRFWLRWNKKPLRPYQSYFRVTFIWALYGGLTGLGLLLLLVLPHWYIGAALILFCLAMMLWFYCSDRRQGCVDAIHSHQLVRWLAHKRRIEDSLK